MSKAVILAINAKYVHSSLSAWCLAAGVLRYSRTRHDVKVIEAAINQPNEDIVGRVAEHTPDVVGISAYIWNAGKLPDILKLLRECLPKALIVLGGPEASCNAEYWLSRGADFVLPGEGERSFPAFLDGVCPAADTGQEFLDPYTEEYLAALNGRIAYIETSRGCPFRCTFCLSGGSGVRFFPLDAAKEQIRKLSGSGAQTVKFVDRTFNCNAKRAYELFEYIIGLNTGCCFHFEVAADLFDDCTLSLLSTAPPGRIQLEAGLQSFHEPALKASSRQTDLAKAERNIRTLLLGGNIHVHVDLIAGLPYETLTDFQAGFDRAYAIGAHTLQLGFLKLLHGSALREQAEALGILYSAEPPYEITSSPWLGSGDLKIIKHAENALQHTYNKGRFLSALRYILDVSELRPFSFYRTLGEAAPNHAIALSDYAGQIYNHCVKLPGIDPEKLREHMIIDWLGMVKGENMPIFMRTEGKRRVQIAKAAEKCLGRKICCNEAAVLPSGKGVFADSLHRDPVTGLYRVYYV